MPPILSSDGAITAAQTLRSIDQNRAFMRGAIAATTHVATALGAAAVTGWTLNKGETPAPATQTPASPRRAQARHEDA